MYAFRVSSILYRACEHVRRVDFELLETIPEAVVIARGYFVPVREAGLRGEEHSEVGEVIIVHELGERVGSEFRRISIWGV